MKNTHSSYKISIYLGLFIVLVLVTLFWFPSVYKTLLSNDFELRNYQMQGMDWVVVLILIGLILYGEKNNLSTLNIQKPTWSTSAIGLGLGGFSMLYIALHQFGLKYVGLTPSFDAQLENPALQEVGPEFVYVYGTFSLLTAAIAEEIIYRGYATERILMLGKPKWMAFVLPLIAFALMHYRKGMDHVLLVLVVGSLMQWYYLKFRNLTINIIGHFFIDGIALVGYFLR